MGQLTVGVLALQGAFAKHVAMLRSLDVNAIEVRNSKDLESCDALIIPGGESTTIMKQLQFAELTEPLRRFAAANPIFGTCAGLILMSHEVISDEMHPFGLLEIAVERNAFGRQAESFSAEIDLFLNPSQKTSFRALFIRAPRIRTYGEAIKVLASYEGEPILVQQGKHLGATFHPELTEDPTIHAYFLSLLKKQKPPKKT